MKPHKQTTSAVSSIAGRYARMTNAELAAKCREAGLAYFYKGRSNAFLRDIKKVCASALAQDQTKGQGK